MSTGPLTSTTTYTLACNGAGGTASQQVIVSINSTLTPTVSLSALPTIVTGGTTTVLTWSSVNATTCMASGAWSGAQPTSGSTTSPALTASTNIFTLTCTGATGASSSSATVSVAPGNPSGKTYTTNFDSNEYPISEGGAWHRANNNFTDVRTENGLAHGTNGVTNTYDDSYALLSDFGPDQVAQAVVYRSQNLNKSVTHEVELLLRFTDDNSGARGYECLFSFDGSIEIVRWNGPIGDFTPLSVTGPQTMGREFVTGDIIKATVTGNTIQLYINGTLVGTASDSSYQTGQPGISFFTRPGGDSANFAMDSYTVSSN